MKAITVVGILLLAVVNWGCGSAGSQSHTKGTQNSTSTISSLQLSPASTSIGTGASQQLVATAKFSDGTSSDVSSSATWSSSDSNIASVSAKELASGVSSGTATITAQSGSVYAFATGSVTGAAANLKSITISPAGSASMPINTSLQFTAIATYNDGSSADLTNVVAWSSSTPSIAKMSATGLASSLQTGTTKISASLAGVTQSTMLTVTAPIISSIAVTPVGLTLAIGIHQQFVATATYTDRSSADLSSGVTWSSSSPSVASIDGTGLATTLAAGSTTMTATLGALSDTSTLTVVAAHLVSLSLSPADPTISIGTLEQFSVVGNFDVPPN